MGASPSMLCFGTPHGPETKMRAKRGSRIASLSDLAAARPSASAASYALAASTSSKQRSDQEAAERGDGGRWGGDAPASGMSLQHGMGMGPAGPGSRSNSQPLAAAAAGGVEHRSEARSSSRQSPGVAAVLTGASHATVRATPESSSSGVGIRVQGAASASATAAAPAAASAEARAEQDLLRGLSAMLSKVPLSMTLLDPEHGPIFQNEQSLGFWGILPREPSASGSSQAASGASNGGLPGLAPSTRSLLESLAPGQPEVVEEMLDCIHMGAPWKRVMQVPALRGGQPVPAAAFAPIGIPTPHDATASAATFAVPYSSGATTAQSAVSPHASHVSGPLGSLPYLLSSVSNAQSGALFSQPPNTPAAGAPNLYQYPHQHSSLLSGTVFQFGSAAAPYPTQSGALFPQSTYGNLTGMRPAATLGPLATLGLASYLSSALTPAPPHQSSLTTLPEQPALPPPRTSMLGSLLPATPFARGAVPQLLPTQATNSAMNRLARLCTTVHAATAAASSSCTNFTGGTAGGSGNASTTASVTAGGAHAWPTDARTLSAPRWLQAAARVPEEAVPLGTPTAPVHGTGPAAPLLEEPELAARPVAAAEAAPPEAPPNDEERQPAYEDAAGRSSAHRPHKVPSSPEVSEQDAGLGRLLGLPRLLVNTWGTDDNASAASAAAAAAVGQPSVVTYLPAMASPDGEGRGGRLNHRRSVEVGAIGAIQNAEAAAVRAGGVRAGGRWRRSVDIVRPEAAAAAAAASAAAAAAAAAVAAVDAAGSSRDSPGSAASVTRLRTGSQFQMAQSNSCPRTGSFRSVHTPNGEGSRPPLDRSWDLAGTPVRPSAKLRTLMAAQGLSSNDGSRALHQSPSHNSSPREHLAVPPGGSSFSHRSVDHAPSQPLPAAAAAALHSRPPSGSKDMHMGASVPAAAAAAPSAHRGLDENAAAQHQQRQPAGLAGMPAEPGQQVAVVPTQPLSSKAVWSEPLPPMPGCRGAARRSPTGGEVLTPTVSGDMPEEAEEVQERAEAAGAAGEGDAAVEEAPGSKGEDAADARKGGQAGPVVPGARKAGSVIEEASEEEVAGLDGDDDRGGRGSPAVGDSAAATLLGSTHDALLLQYSDQTAEAVGGTAVGGTAAQGQYAWHDVELVPFSDSVTGSNLVILVQTDITARVDLEIRMATFTEAQIATLEQMFPRHVLEFMARVSASGQLSTFVADPTLSTLACAHEGVSILFMDVVGFTDMSKQVTPAEVLQFLNSLFTLLDELIDTFNVYKVDTSGDCYIVAGALMTHDEEGFLTLAEEVDAKKGAEKVMAFAKALLRCAQTVPMPHNGQPTMVRVGIHTGPVVSGLIGTKLPKFSIFGDTVNCASRMESTGRKGCIQVSEATHGLLSDTHTFSATGGVMVKGKGLMQTYIWDPEAAPDERYTSAEDFVHESSALALHQMKISRSETSLKLSAEDAAGVGAATAARRRAPPSAASSRSRLVVGSGGGGGGGVELTQPQQSVRDSSLLKVILSISSNWASAGSATGLATATGAGVSASAAGAAASLHRRESSNFHSLFTLLSPTPMGMPPVTTTTSNLVYYTAGGGATASATAPSPERGRPPARRDSEADRMRRIARTKSNAAVHDLD